MTEAPPIVRCVGLGRRFGGVRAVADVDMEIAPGERRAILGPNGAGKSTLFNLITGELPPTEGSVELFGRDVTFTPVRRRVHMGLGRTFQTSRVLRGLSVENNLYLACQGVRRGRLRPWVTETDRRLRERAGETARRVGLEERLGVRADTLSHGERRQLEVGIALATGPRLLMLDEPAAGLSRMERQSLTRLLFSLDRDVTLLIIEHDMDVALSVAERVTMMHEGRVLIEGTPETIRSDNTVHELYLGRGHARA